MAGAVSQAITNWLDGICSTQTLLQSLGWIHPTLCHSQRKDSDQCKYLHGVHKSRSIPVIRQGRPTERMDGSWPRNGNMNSIAKLQSELQLHFWFRFISFRLGQIGEMVDDTLDYTFHRAYCVVYKTLIYLYFPPILNDFPRFTF